jgi:pimeloyl-ACP methyl ester carboxylesterase
MRHFAQPVLLALFSVLLAACSGEAAPRLEEIPMNEVSVDGTRIRYIEKGEGTPLVLVHGIPTSSFLWRDMIEELSSHGRVIAPDLPGFGLSDPPPDGDYSISGYAGLLESFLESLSITEATLVCHDFGGPITVTYALRSPDTVNETYLGTLRADSTKDLKFIEDNLHTIDKPTLIIWAEEDSYLPLRLGERIHEHIEGSSFKTLPACGHFLQEDEPEEVTKLINEFLER